MKTLASEKLVEMMANNELTDEQLDNLNDWNIINVDNLRRWLISKLADLQDDPTGVDYEQTVIALGDLIGFTDDDYVVYDEDGVAKLDMDTLNDVLGIE